jgi:hypothetical protein
VVGLTVSLVPGLNENSEEMQKKVYSVLDSISDRVGKRFFYSAVWTAILRVPKVRIPCFKYFQKEFKASRKLSDGKEDLPETPPEDPSKQSDLPSDFKDTSPDFSKTLAYAREGLSKGSRFP